MKTTCALVQLRGTDAVLMVHAELPGTIDDAARIMAAEVPPPHPPVQSNDVRSRPRAAEDEAIELLLGGVRRARLAKSSATPRRSSIGSSGFDWRSS